jgi:hypothetical protein
MREIEGRDRNKRGGEREGERGMELEHERVEMVEAWANYRAHR